MKLVIIEGPGKQATIKKYLGDDYTVFATKGHIRDLPEKGMGIDITNDFTPNYQPIPSKKAVIEECKKLASKAEKIYLATDPDREGEAISWHIAYLLNLKDDDECRITFNEITHDVVAHAIEHPRKLDYDLINAQQARRILDRLVGYKLSPILNKKIAPKLSAGRVQSVALKLVVDREREIRNFVPQEYWTVNALFNEQNVNFKTLLGIKNNKKFEIKSKEQLDKILEELKQNDYIVDKLKKEVKYQKANPPFITSSMQQDAGQKLKMSLDVIAKTAQSLYEGVQTKTYGKRALITYIRTDSTRVSDVAQKAAKQFIIQNYGEEFAPSKFNHYQSKASAQEGHEAIRPIDINITPDSIKAELSSNQYRLYKLIYERFLASQMSDYVYDSVVLDIKNGAYTFRVSGNTPKFKGFKAVYDKEQEVDETETKDKLPQVNEGQKLNCTDIKYEQKFTKPPTRYNEPSFVKLMEAKGIGRPATYVQTVQILFNRNYCVLKDKYFVPTEIGETVCDYLTENFSDIMNVKFTAEMEEKLDEISKGKLNYKDVIRDFYDGFEKQIEEVYKDSSKNPPVQTDIPCDKCGAFMVIRTSASGKFLACPNFPKCKNTKSLNDDGTIKEVEPPKETEEKCPQCGANLLLKTGKNGKFLACPNFPKCKFTKNYTDNTDDSIGKESDVVCDKCGAKMIFKMGKNGKFLACPNFPKCKNTKNIK